MIRRIALAAAATAAIAISAAGTADAAILPPVQNQTGEAGYYVQHWDNWHIRDAHATFKITAAMEALNHDATFPGAVGVELCDPDNGYTAQLGVTFIGNQFEILAAHGNLDTTSTGQDPCVQNGVIVTQDSNAGTAVQLAGAVTYKSNNSAIWSAPASPVNIGAATGDPVTWVVPNNRNQPSAEQAGLTVGDTVTLDLYYNPTSSHGKNSLQFTTDVSSATGAFLGENQYTDSKVKPQQFFEAAIGADNNGAPTLTAPATLPLVSFTDATFTNYTKSAVNKLNGGWGLTEAQTVNGASQVTMTPTTAVGNTFSIFEGSATP
jgi:hypothetical protein